MIVFVLAGSPGHITASIDDLEDALLSTSGCLCHTLSSLLLMLCRGGERVG